MHIHIHARAGMVGLLLKGRRLWQKGFRLSPQRCRCCPVRSAYQGMQHGDVQLSNITAHLASPPGHQGSANKNGGLLCYCSHRLRLMGTVPADIHISNKTLGSCSGEQCSDKNMTTECCKRGHHGGFACYPHPFKISTAFESASINSSNSLCIKTLGSCNGGHCSDKNMTMECCKRGHHGGFTRYPHLFKSSTAFESASINSSNASGKTSSKILMYAPSSAVEYGSSFMNSLSQSRKNGSGLWSWSRRDPLCIGSRRFLSVGNNKTLSDRKSQSFEDSAFPVPSSDAVGVDTNASLSESDEDFDFRNFPALKSSYYQDYERPSEMQVKKRVTWQTRRKLVNTDTKLTVECIPKPKACTYDFGLGDMLSKPPPLEAGARPQGGFDTNISLDECEAAPSEAPSSSFVFGVRTENTPEAENWSEK